MLKTIEWTGSAARLLDQTKLPTETVYVDITNERQMWDAIKRLVVRGAPAIGVAAAFGVYLGVRNAIDASPEEFNERVDAVCDYLATSRPTAVNLFWAIDRIKCVARESLGEHPGSSAPCHVVRDTLDAILNECQTMLEEDTAICRAIGEHGLKLLESLEKSDGRINVLTHCNAGGLATVQYGTALAPIYVGAEQGVRFHVFADETRPLLQGSRITAYELQKNNIPVTVICDNMAAAVMSQGKVKAVIVGTDRVAANGDVANKIGTLGVAILAKHYGIPFYVAAPISSIDMSLSSGAEIPIEERAASEISNGMGRQTSPTNVDVFNPAFDVTPNALVTALITEKGVVFPPYESRLRETVG